MNLRVFNLLTALCLCLLPLLASAQTFQSPLLTPAELAARLPDRELRVIDIRSAASDKGSTFDFPHVAGAQWAPYALWRGPKDNPGALPSADDLGALIRRLGIDTSTPVVIVYNGGDATDFGAAARVYWTLKVAGLKQLAILNGGIKAWSAAGLPLVTAASAAPAPSHFELKIDHELIATRTQVAQVLAAGKSRVIDARPREYFEGGARHPLARAPGTLVGAKNVDSDVWFAPDGNVLPIAELRRIAAQQGVATDQPTVSFCNTGHWAATNWFVLSELLDQHRISLYPESMVDWSRSGLAMQNVPSRWQQFRDQLRAAMGQL